MYSRAESKNARFSSRARKIWRHNLNIKKEYPPGGRGNGTYDEWNVRRTSLILFRGVSFPMLVAGIDRWKFLSVKWKWKQDFHAVGVPRAYFCGCTWYGVEGKPITLFGSYYMQLYSSKVLEMDRTQTMREWQTRKYPENHEWRGGGRSFTYGILRLPDETHGEREVFHKIVRKMCSSRSNIPFVPENKHSCGPLHPDPS